VTGGFVNAHLDAGAAEPQGTGETGKARARYMDMGHGVQPKP